MANKKTKADDSIFKEDGTIDESKVEQAEVTVTALDDSNFKVETTQAVVVNKDVLQAELDELTNVLTQKRKDNGIDLLEKEIARKQAFIDTLK